jgi:prepilin signal peptidase PulO-like enzyme (type II secretory pathway)
MVTIIALYFFALGLTFGSFALVVADRTVRRKDWVKGRSSCDSCHKKLGFIDLVPLLSWLSTAGKCRYCRVKLSWTYPATELGLGLAFTVTYLNMQDLLHGIAAPALFGLWLAGLVLMTVLFVIDAKTMKLPYMFLFPLIALAATYSVTSIVTATDPMSSFLNTLASLAVGAGVFAILFVVSRGKWIGDSDVLFGIVIGLYLGKPLESWLAIILACLSGLLYAAVFSITKKKSIRRLKIPFGPFLIIGLYFTFLYGAQIIDWYTQTVLFM